MESKRKISIGGLIVGICVAFGVFSAVLGPLLIGFQSGPSYSKTEAVVRMLHDGCRNYQAEYGVFPPADPDGGTVALVRCLSAPRVRGASTRPPIIEFRPDMFEGGKLVDEWGRRNAKGVDIWSPGRNGKDEADGDDLVNWESPGY